MPGDTVPVPTEPCVRTGGPERLSATITLPRVPAVWFAASTFARSFAPSPSKSAIRSRPFSAPKLELQTRGETNAEPFEVSTETWPVAASIEATSAL